MTRLTISYLDPGVEVIRRPGTTWLVSGPFAGHHPRLDPDGRVEPEAELCRRLGDATVLRVDDVGRRPVRIRMWRGATSSHEIYFAVRPDGDIHVGDHFRNVVCRVPVAERQPSEAVTIDHFLFRHARGRDTYSAAVRRVGHGEFVAIDPFTGHVEHAVIDRLASRQDRRPFDAYAADVDTALATEMDALREIPGAAMLFSGGLDSTLLQSYLKDDVPALHLSVDDERFHFGGRSMRASAAALGIVPEQVVLAHAEYLEQVEEAVDGRGVPPNYPQWATLGRVFPSPYELFIVGERGGMFAREGGRIPFTARHFTHLPGSLLRPALRAAAVFGRPHRLRLVARQAPMLAADPGSPDGWGVQMPQAYGDRAWAERVFGATAVRARYEARLAYIAEHVELLPATADRYVRHIEIGSWQDFYNENDSQFRSLGLAHGKRVVDPFVLRPVIDATLGVPPVDRWADGARSKHVVERLVRRRVPAYPESAPKDQIIVPYVRSYRSGPLAGVWERYEIPDLFTGADRTRLLGDRAGLPAWNAITWAIWQRRIAGDAGLRPLPASFELNWDMGPPWEMDATGRCGLGRGDIVRGGLNGRSTEVVPKFGPGGAR